MKIALVQMNSAVGDLEGNIKKMISFVNKARYNEADLVVFPECALLGNPLRDLIGRSDFIRAGQQALEQFLSHTVGMGVLLSTVSSFDTGRPRKSAILIKNGEIVDRTEHSIKVLDYQGMKIGIVMDQAWNDDSNSQSIPNLYIHLSSCPYYYNSLEKRISFFSGIAEKHNRPLLFVNQVGGNDELIFDGSSMVFDQKGSLTHLGKPFEEDLLIYDTELPCQSIAAPEEDISWLYRALVLGFRDYFHKTGFTKTLLGLSGGIDSALAACIAVDALGKNNVMGIAMPSRYSSDHSLTDAEQLARSLEIEYRVLPIEDIFASYIKLVNGSEQTAGDLAEENIQARIRGDLLMFISNREGRMLVNTSNKSESAVGYSTLYGDMCGSLAPIGDVYKTMVYKLCDYINREWERIPVNTLIKPPSAELRPNQLDQDSLPDYIMLDGIIQLYVEENLSADEIAEKGFDRELVLKIMSMIDRMEYKRRQAPPSLKVTSHALGVDGRMPIIQRFHRQ
jgi:NAD+ synthase (glutamine-hydrolysing)